MKKIAIIGSIHQDGWEVLKKNGYEVFEITNLSKENLITELNDVNGIGLRTSTLDSDILCKCKNLKIIARHGVGYDNVDVDFMNKNKIALSITGTSNAISVAEHVMTMFLYILKKINLSNKLVKEGNFSLKSSLPNIFELYNKNILILGFGRIGKALAQRCLGFDCNVYVYDPYVDEKIIKNSKCYKIELDEGLSICDLISIHLPLNNKTKNLISKKQFEQMKSNCVIVNTARGGIINETDLIYALKNKQILGAGLDVFEKEPPDNNNELLTLPNILLTPHNAALSLECRKRMALEMAENINYFITNDPKLNLKNIVNKDIL